MSENYVDYENYDNSENYVDYENYANHVNNGHEDSTGTGQGQEQ